MSKVLLRAMCAVYLVLAIAGLLALMPGTSIAQQLTRTALTSPLTLTQADGLANTLDGLNTTSFMYINPSGSAWDMWTGAVTQGGTWTMEVSSLPSNASVNIAQLSGAAPAATNAFPVRISNGTTFPTLASDSTFGTTTYTETSSTGPVVGGIRNDTLEALASTNNEAAPLQMDASGRLYSRADAAANGNAIIACDNIAIIDNSAASGNTQIIALSGTTVVYICSYTLTAEATVDVRLVRGTGSACATGDLSITGLYAFSTTTGLLGVSRGSGLGMVTKGTAGDAICVETSGAVQVNGEITYAQY